jgi:hypothetical protein
VITFDAEISIALREIRIGEVFEVHVSDRGEVSHHGFRSTRDFVKDWAYALAGKNCGEEVFAGETPPFSRHRAYLGVVHADGAYLREL